MSYSRTPRVSSRNDPQRNPNRMIKVHWQRSERTRTLFAKYLVKEAKRTGTENYNYNEIARKINSKLGLTGDTRLTGMFLKNKRSIWKELYEVMQVMEQSGFLTVNRANRFKLEHHGSDSIWMDFEKRQSRKSVVFFRVVRRSLEFPEFEVYQHIEEAFKYLPPWLEFDQVDLREVEDELEDVQRVEEKTESDNAPHSPVDIPPEPQVTETAVAVISPAEPPALPPSPSPPPPLPAEPLLQMTRIEGIHARVARFFEEGKLNEDDYAAFAEISDEALESFLGNRVHLGERAFLTNVKVLVKRYRGE